MKLTITLRLAIMAGGGLGLFQALDDASTDPIRALLVGSISIAVLAGAALHMYKHPLGD